MAAVPDPSQEHLYGQPGGVLRELPAARTGRAGRAGASDAGALPHRDCRVLLHRILPGQGDRLAPGRPVRVRHYYLGSPAVYGLHSGFRPDDDLGVRLQAWLVPGGQVPGPPRVAGGRCQRQLRLRQHASQRGGLHHLRAPGHAAPQEVRAASSVSGGPSDSPRRRAGHHGSLGPFGYRRVGAGHREAHGAARRYAHAHILRRDHAADPQQHAGDHPRGLRDGCSGQGLAGQAGA